MTRYPGKKATKDKRLQRVAVCVLEVIVVGGGGGGAGAAGDGKAGLGAAGCSASLSSSAEATVGAAAGASESEPPAIRGVAAAAGGKAKAGRGANAAPAAAGASSKRQKVISDFFSAPPPGSESAPKKVGIPVDPRPPGIEGRVVVALFAPAISLHPTRTLGGPLSYFPQTFPQALSVEQLVHAWCSGLTRGCMQPTFPSLSPPLPPSPSAFPPGTEWGAVVSSGAAAGPGAAGGAVGVPR